MSAGAAQAGGAPGVFLSGVMLAPSLLTYGFDHKRVGKRVHLLEMGWGVVVGEQQAGRQDLRCPSQCSVRRGGVRGQAQATGWTQEGQEGR